MSSLIQFLIAVLILLIFAPIDAVSHQKFKRKTNIFFHISGLFFVAVSAIILITKEFKFGFFLPFGIVIFLLGFYISHKGVKELRKNFWNAEKIIGSGIYSKVRHPIYLGLIIMLIGLSIVVNSLLFLIYAIIAIIIIFLLIVHEEKHLSKKFVKYKNYKEKVPMLLPKIK